MVAISSELKTAIAASVTKAEKRTGAEIAVILTPSSDGYQSYMLLYGFALGSAAALWLWWSKTITAFPVLLLVQALCIACTAFVPFIRRAGLCLVPNRVLHHHAARRASQEFLFLARNVPPERPVVLLYVSLAERYVHVLHSRAASAKVPADVWDGVVASFTAKARQPGLAAAFDVAIAKIADALAPHFPDKGEPNTLSNRVR